MGLWDNSEIFFFLIHNKTLSCGPQKNHLRDVLLRAKALCFNGDIWKVIPELSLLAFLIYSTDDSAMFVTMYKCKINSSNMNLKTVFCPSSNHSSFFRKPVFFKKLSALFFVSINSPFLLPAVFLTD